MKTKPRIQSQPLPPEEWDFHECPKERLVYCRNYEYAREVEWVRARYFEWSEKRRADGLSEGIVGPEGFDEFGNLHIEEVIYGPGPDDVRNILSIELPPGFPTTPYQRVHHKPFQSEEKPRPLVETCDPGNLGQRDSHAKGYVALRIDWDAPPTRLVEAFGRWLKGNRPHLCPEYRGKSYGRRCLADLRALGAFRLLKTMSASEAQEHTCGLGEELYAKLPDWYAANKRAKAVLEFEFDLKRPLPPDPYPD